MNFKKRVNGSWTDTPYYIHNTATDTITTLPAVLYPNATTATVELKGNTVQNGTPTPDNPIMPQGCGDLETVGTKAGQYEIPISSANTTTPVYLGEVETTRKIKKLVLTGEERWYKSGAYRGSFYLSDVLPVPISLTEQAYCSHAEFTSISTYAQNKFCFNGSPINLNLWIGESSWTTDDFKAYLAAQYAAGTPVTIWYVLATEETAVVNEPLMKIGEYADEVSGITIPTITSKDTFDVDTTLKPSEVSLSYTGWHDATVEEWDGSQWNE